MEIKLAKDARLFHRTLVTCGDSGVIHMLVETIAERASHAKIGPEDFVISADVLDTLLERAGIAVVGGKLGK